MDTMEIFKIGLEKAKQIEKNNDQPPRARPFKNRFFCLATHLEAMQQMADEGKNSRQPKITLITGKLLQ